MEDESPTGSKFRFNAALMDLSGFEIFSLCFPFVYVQVLNDFCMNFNLGIISLNLFNLVTCISEYGFNMGRCISEV